MESQGIEFPEADALILYWSYRRRAGQVAEKLTWQLRSRIYTIKDIMGRSVKAQMKYADKLSVRYTLILGDNEIDSNKARLKDMKTGETKDISLDTLIDRLVKNKA